MKTAGDIVRENRRKVVCTSTEATVHEALTEMVDKKIGAIIVREGETYVGIWTERDVMVTDLKSVPADTPVIKLLDKFLGLRIRHLLVEEDGEYVGLISSGDAIKADLVAKAHELEELNAMVSWDYYEDWGWQKKK